MYPQLLYGKGLLIKNATMISFVRIYCHLLSVVLLYHNARYNTQKLRVCCHAAYFCFHYLFFSVLLLFSFLWLYFSLFSLFAFLFCLLCWPVCMEIQHPGLCLNSNCMLSSRSSKKNNSHKIILSLISPFLSSRTMDSCCRICGQEGLGSSAYRQIQPSASLIQRIYGVNISEEDATVFPKLICNGCRLKLSRFVHMLPIFEYMYK